MTFFKLLTTTILIILLFTQAVNAQKDSLNHKNIASKGTSIGISEPDLIDELMPLIIGLGSSSREMLEEKSLKSYMMPPRQMSDAANPESYALATLMEFYLNYNNNYKVNLSPDFISLNLVREETLSLHEAFKFLISEGTVSAAIMPYDSPDIPRAVFATEKFKIQNYLHIFREEMKDRQKIFETKKALMRGNPVMIKMNISENFKQLEGTRYWVPSKSKIFRQMPFIVVGFDQDLEAFEILSFWGNSWAADGYLWVDYEDFGKFVTDGFVVLPTEKTLSKP